MNEPSDKAEVSPDGDSVVTAMNKRMPFNSGTLLTPRQYHPELRRSRITNWPVRAGLKNPQVSP
jgi:hypothetical protein